MYIFTNADVEALGSYFDETRCVSGQLVKSGSSVDLKMILVVIIIASDTLKSLG